RNVTGVQTCALPICRQHGREDTPQMGQQLGVSILDREVGGTCCEVEGTYRVPLDRRRLPDRDTVGEVGRFVPEPRQIAVAAPVEEEACQLQRIVPAGLAVQL